MPLKGTKHVNKPLSQLSLAFMDQAEYKSGLVAPSLRVNHRSDLYYKWPKDSFMRNLGKPRAACAESVGAGLNLETDQYLAQVYALHYDICMQDLADNDEVIDEERAAVEFVTRGLLLGKEVDFASKFLQNGSGWDIESTPATKWDAGGDPVADLRAKLCDMRDGSGYKPNTLVIDGKTECCIMDSAAFISRLAGGGTVDPAMGNADLLARMLGVQRVVVMDAVVAQGDGTLAPVSSGSALLLYVAPAPSRRSASAIYTFNWDKMVWQSMSLISQQAISRSNLRLTNRCRTQAY